MFAWSEEFLKEFRTFFDQKKRFISMLIDMQYATKCETLKFPTFCNMCSSQIHSNWICVANLKISRKQQAVNSLKGFFSLCFDSREWKTPTTKRLLAIKLKTFSSLNDVSPSYFGLRRPWCGHQRGGLLYHLQEEGQIHVPRPFENSDSLRRPCCHLLRLAIRAAQFVASLRDQHLPSHHAILASSHAHHCAHISILHYSHQVHPVKYEKILESFTNFICVLSYKS